MTIFSRLALVAACSLACQTAAIQAAPHASAADAQALLARAVLDIRDSGPTKAFADFNEAKGAYNNTELYVFVFNLKGIYEAYGANPRLVGNNVSDLTDAEGKPIVREMIEIAKATGHGKVNYVWLNRADNRIEHKMSLIELVGDHVVGVGYYPN